MRIRWRGDWRGLAGGQSAFVRAFSSDVVCVAAADEEVMQPWCGTRGRERRECSVGQNAAMCGGPSRSNRKYR